MTTASTQSSAKGELRSVSGVQLMQGLGVQPSKGFWAEAWSSVVQQPRALASLCWIGLIALFAVISPLVANGHPVLLRELDEAGRTVRLSSPMYEYMSAADLLLLLAAVVGVPLMLMPISGLSRGSRLGWLLVALLQGGLIVAICAGVQGYVAQREVPPWVREIERSYLFVPGVAAIVSAIVGVGFLWVQSTRSLFTRGVLVGVVSVMSGFAVTLAWGEKPENFSYRERVDSGEATAVFTLVPFSPSQRGTSLRLLEPGSTPLTPQIIEEERTGRDAADLKAKESQQPKFILGTDSIGQDVLSQMLHACRLAISIGLVSTGIAVVIGVTMGALMGYFGGWVDLLLYRVVEVFMAIPVLFLLIVAAAVLPRNTYVMMAIIGCVSWTSAARYTRAEFMKLRDQDFVQGAKAVGLPLRSILFKHMLPNGVTPVLVDASFAIAAAIQIEAILSFLGLGPAEQASWGKLLASATNEVGEFKWWLAIFPGFAIFLTALSYNLLGEALRDAIDPKLKKARV